MLSGFLAGESGIALNVTINYLFCFFLKVQRALVLSANCCHKGSLKHMLLHWKIILGYFFRKQTSLGTLHLKFFHTDFLESVALNDGTFQNASPL